MLQCIECKEMVDFRIHGLCRKCAREKIEKEKIELANEVIEILWKGYNSRFGINHYYGEDKAYQKWQDFLKSQEAK